MTVLTNKPEVDRIYITPTPKGWREAKKVKTILIDWEMSITIGGVYIYTLG